MMSAVASAPSVLRLVDIGANLCDSRFSSAAEVEHVLSRAWQAGLASIFVTAGRLSEAVEALAFVQRDPQRLFTTVGVHPTRCSEFEASGEPEVYFERLLELISGPQRQNIVAVGELGLDYDRVKFCSIETQKKYFERQFELAERSGLPLFLHDRNTAGDFIEIMRRNRSRFTGGVVHSFTGTEAELEQLLALDLYIGVNGCSLKTQENLNAVSRIPLDRLLLETDAPYCEIRNTHAGKGFVKTTWQCRKKDADLSKPQRGRNEPCHIRLLPHSWHSCF